MSLKVYIDTNIYINAILNRDNELSQKVLTFLDYAGASLYLNDISVINIHYHIRKKLDRDSIKDELKRIRQEHFLVSVDNSIIDEAFDSEFKDFEDGVQYFCAKRVGAELIITDNKKDFKHSDIKILSAKEFYDQYMLED